MVKYFNKDQNQKFGIQRPGIQKRSFNGRSGGGGRDSMGGFDRKNKYNLVAEDLSAPDWSNVTLKPFKKDFYVPHEIVEQR